MPSGSTVDRSTHIRPEIPDKSAVLSVQILVYFFIYLAGTDLNCTHVKKIVCHFASNGVMKSCCVLASSMNEEALSDNGKFSVYNRNATPIKIILPLRICNVSLSIKRFSYFQDRFILREALIAYKSQVGIPKKNVHRSSYNARLSNSKLTICCC
jgi:hypothetical protein